MKGVIIWAQSNCRSTMALYRGIIHELDVPSLITLWHYKKCEIDKDIREQIGFTHDEFSDLPTEPVGENYEKGLSIIKAHPGWHHVFCVWQGSSVYRRLLVEAKRSGSPVAVMCESPCNMASGWRKIAKSIYMRFALPILARKVIQSADVFVNYSGDDGTGARQLGWTSEKIIPFGYFSPPIPGSKVVLRKTNKPFHILATGILTRYRGADILVEALRLLRERGIKYCATITQTGELLDELKAKAKIFGLPIKFAGFVGMSELVRLYETCAVYVGAGRSEPWGMRLNDVLQCGAPIVVSRGMGGVQLVDRYGCGLSFLTGDAKCLADALQRLATDSDFYRQVANKAVSAAKLIAPEQKAKELIKNLKGWL